MAGQYSRWPVPANAITKVDSINGLTGAITLDAGDGIDIAPTGNTLTISATDAYVPTTPADWDGTAPATIQEALDRLASAVVGLLGGPIP